MKLKMVFLNKIFYENIGIPKSKISESFILFLQEYIKKMIDFYILMDYEQLLQINVEGIPIREDKNVIQYILTFTKNQEKSQIIHDKIYGMIHYFAKFVTESGKKCSFESIIEIFNSVNFSHDFVIYFLKPIESYTQKINLKLIVSIEGVYIQQETFYLYAEICCSNLWIKGILSNTFKELVYFYFLDFIQNFKNWLINKKSIFDDSEYSENKLEIIFQYITENYSENLGKHMKNQILKYEESKQNWENINIYRIYEVPEIFVDYCKVIIQYLLVEFIYTSKCIIGCNEKKKINPVQLFLGMEEAELMELPIFFKNIRDS